MSNSVLPFLLTKRCDKGGIWYARVRKLDGTVSERRSTGTKDKSEAIKVASEWYRTGKLKKSKSAYEIAEAEIPFIDKRTIFITQIISMAKKVNWKQEEIADVLERLKKEGYILNYTLRRDNEINAYDYLTNFWDYDKSGYIKEKLRKGQRIGRRED